MTGYRDFAVSPLRGIKGVKQISNVTSNSVTTVTAPFILLKVNRGWCGADDDTEYRARASWRR